MNTNSYELTGPFSSSLNTSVSEDVISHAVRLKAERNSPHPLNPVGQLRRVVSSQYVVQDAVLLLSLQFFEIFTVVHERQVSVPQRRGTQIKNRIKAVATGHLPNIPKRLIKREVPAEEAEEDDPGRDLQSLRSNLSEADYANVEGLLKDHVFSCGVAFAQVLKIRSKGNSVTVFYHPNSMKATKLSKTNLGTAMRFTLCLDSPEETTSLLKNLEKRMARYTQAALFLGEQWVLPSAMHIVAVTRPIPGSNASDEQQLSELLLAKDPPWGTAIPAPSSWGPQAQGSSTPLWAFLMTPLGYGKCEVSPQTVSLYAKGKEASFYVGVRHPQVSGSALATTSQLQQVRPSDAIDEVEILDDDVDSDSDDSWQPEDSEEASTRGPSPLSANTQSCFTNTSSYQPNMRTGSTNSSSTASRSPGAISKGRASSSQSSTSSHHVRVHCHAKFVTSSEHRQQEQPRGIPLPGGHHIQAEYLAGIAVLPIAGLWLAASWTAAFLTLLNLLVALLIVRQRKEPPSKRPRELLRTVSADQTAGGWVVKLLRAEIVTDEPWSAAGESILAQVTQDDSEESSEQRNKRLADEYGFPEDVVNRYLLAFHGDEVTAHRRMHATCEWRQASDAKNILQQPQPNFRFFKDMFRHGLLGTTKEGHPIWFMKVGDMKHGHKVFRDSNLTRRDLARHVALCMDYMYMEIEAKPLPNGRALWILDLKGMGMTDLGSDAFEMGKEIAGVISAHWPERLYRCFIINMPGFFSILWRVVEPMLSASTRRKIRLLRGKTDMLKEMLEEMDEEDIPAEYGGKLDGDFYSSHQEKEFWSFVEQLGSSS